METMFETKRLVIRRFREDDAQQLYENHMDEAVRKWFPNECYADPAEALDAIRFYADCVDNGHLPFVLGVELKETGELIGDTGISEVEGKPDESEIGYCIGEKFRCHALNPQRAIGNQNHFPAFVHAILHSKAQKVILKLAGTSKIVYKFTFQDSMLLLA